MNENEKYFLNSLRYAPQNIRYTQTLYPLFRFAEKRKSPPLQSFFPPKIPMSKLVGEVGLEPTTSASRTLRASQTALLPELPYSY